VGIAQQIGNVELFGAAGQAVAAVGAAVSLATGKPVTGIFKHGVAVFAKGFHVVGHRQVSEPQNFGNVNAFWTGQALVALAALLWSQGLPGCCRKPV